MKWLRQAWHRLVDAELDRPVRLPDRESMTAGQWNAWVGAAGERLAAKHLQRAGWKVLWRNFRPREGGEVDLVCRDGGILVFCEVKTRTGGSFGEPGRAVDRVKRRLVIRGANAWLRELNHPEIIFRFDIAEVLLRDGEKPAVRVAEGAFTTPQAGLGM